MTQDRQTLAVFIDFENLALGFKERKGSFNIERVLGRLVEKGNIVVKRAYADWYRFTSFKDALHEAAIELIEIPKRHMTGKNSADIRLCVDAMDMCFSKTHIDTFVIVSGDSDFSPLVSKLKENGKTVIGLGLKDSTSELLRDNCDEFIYYEDLETEIPGKHVVADNDPEAVAFALLMESLAALRRENRDTLWSSMIKATMKRKSPAFNEAAIGYKSFSRFLEAAATRGLVALSRDTPNKSYIVTRFGEEIDHAERAPEPDSARKGSRREPPLPRRNPGGRGSTKSND